MVIFKISHAGIAQTHPENHNTYTAAPHKLLTRVGGGVGADLATLQTGPLHTTIECI